MTSLTDTQGSGTEQNEQKNYQQGRKQAVMAARSERKLYRGGGDTIGAANLILLVRKP